MRLRTPVSRWVAAFNLLVSMSSSDHLTPDGPWTCPSILVIIKLTTSNHKRFKTLKPEFNSILFISCYLSMGKYFLKGYWGFTPKTFATKKIVIVFRVRYIIDNSCFVNGHLCRLCGYFRRSLTTVVLSNGIFSK